MQGNYTVLSLFMTFQGMFGNRPLYWFAQIAGWMFYLVTILVYNYFGSGINLPLVYSGVIIVVTGISLTHLYRLLIVRLDWLRLTMIQAIPRIIFASLLLGIVFHFIQGFLQELLIPNFRSFLSQSFTISLQMVMNWTFLILFWSLLYFIAHYFVNYKNHEIQNLKLQATQTEIELNNLKSQLNPHFMFNALNSVRALVSENPNEAKEAITKLSNMLRAALQTGKRKLISLEEELQLVQNYLSIEKIRFEDRLQYQMDIQPGSNSLPVPPLMIQTLVENAVKHGVSALPQGGEILLSVNHSNECLTIEVSNSGRYKTNKPSSGTGVGLKNTCRRLKLLYGEECKLTIENKNNQVVTRVDIPLNKEV